jgi:phosphate transport system ATP-binding protein
MRMLEDAVAPRAAAGGSSAAQVEPGPAQPGEPAGRAATSPRPKFEVSHLDFYYGPTRALQDVNLKLMDRNITAFIGPSGCGKSTLLRVLNRMYALYPGHRAVGEVLLDGENILAPTFDVASLRCRVGMVFQKATPFPMSVFDNVAFGIRLARRISRRALAERVEGALRDAALWDEVKDKLSQDGRSLSGGQQQRLCVARTLAVEPEVLLFDEPTAALDPISTLRIEETLQSLRERYCIAIVTHNLQQAARVSSVTAFMYLGELVEVGPTEQMFTAPRDRRTDDYVTGRFG